MTKKNYSIAFFSLALAASMASCSSKLAALGPENFTVTPMPLEAHAQQVPATINGTFPEKYMHKKALVTVTPVLRYNGTEVRGAATSFQGEKVLGNNQTISNRLGGSYTIRTSFPYQEAMQKSDLYLVFGAQIGKKVVQIPEVKVGIGVVATSQLVQECLKQAEGSWTKDRYQRITQNKQEATIQFLLGQANLRASELNNSNIQAFIAKLAEIKDNPETTRLSNIEVSAYASPDGGYALNEKLAGKREANSTEYVKKNLKKNQQDTYVDTKYTAEDWEGFSQLVAASNIQDKDLIIRVLSMYKDPEEREREIKNISTVYADLANGILPQLRRARLTANYELIGRDDAQILAQFRQDPTKLSVDELLYAGTLVNDDAQKQAIYTAATRQYPKDCRAFTNLGQLALHQGNLPQAKSYYQQALQVNPKQAAANANMGLLCLIEGDQQQAQQYLSKGTGADGLNEAMAALYISQGQYAQAVSTLQGDVSNTAALAQILNKDYSGAEKTLLALKSPTALSYYLKAIQCARTNNLTGMNEALQQVAAKDAQLDQRAKSDLEFTLKK